MERIVALGLGFGVLAALFLGHVHAAPFGPRIHRSCGGAVRIAIDKGGPFTKGRVVEFSKAAAPLARRGDQ